MKKVFRRGAVLGAALVIGLATGAGAQCVGPVKLFPLDGAAGDAFGTAVASVGDTVIGGAPNGNGGTGAVYVFRQGAFGAPWAQEARLLASDPQPLAQFGSALAFDGTTLVVGAPSADSGGRGAVYVYSRAGTVWSFAQKIVSAGPGLGDTFGGSLSLSGNTLVVGAPGTSGGGNAYVYVRTGAGQPFALQATIVSQDRTVSDLFGTAVALSGDTLWVGAPLKPGQAGIAQGAAYVFQRAGTVWGAGTKFVLPPGTANSWDQFGNTLQVEGDVAVIGADQNGPFGPANGKAVVYTRSAGVWSASLTLTNPSPAVAERFSASIKLAGGSLIVGSPAGGIPASTIQGSATVFTGGGGSWTVQQKLTAPDGQASMRLGTGASIAGNLAAVGAPQRSGPGGAGAGTVYVFNRINGVWITQPRLAADVDANGTVGANDLSILLGCFGLPASGGCTPADVDGNGSVGANDLSLLLSNFGASVSACPG
ncbi:MAG: hypothetical protein IBJ11_10140 [Phycisphaerales bacterium]|nr:hypothetical protein [Phycisphaerales bacterium]